MIEVEWREQRRFHSGAPMIRFVCSCGKPYRVSDHLAGKRVACRACGTTFRVPGIAVPAGGDSVAPFPPIVVDDGPNVFVPRPRDRGRRSALVLLGVLLGVTIAGLGIAAWERGTPPGIVAAKTRARAARAPAPETPAPDSDGAGSYAPVAVFATLFVVTPAVLPAILSRRRYLSVGRWLVMAGLCAFVGVVGGFVLFAAFASPPSGGGGLTTPRGMAVFVGMASLASSIFGFGGSLLAAAIHPRDAG